MFYIINTINFSFQVLNQRIKDKWPNCLPMYSRYVVSEWGTANAIENRLNWLYEAMNDIDLY